MSNRILAVLFLALAGTGGWPAGAQTWAPAPADDPSRLTLIIGGKAYEPDWLRRPGPEALAGQYPAQAQSEGVEGQASLRCTVVADGTLTGCAVTAEAPEGYGFGAAALGMSSNFKMRKTTSDGTPVEGGTVSITIQFRLG